MAQSWKAYFFKTIEEVFEARREKNPAYSLRAYARDLGMSPGSLSDFRRKRRSISVKKAWEIFMNLSPTPKMIKDFRLLLGMETLDEARTVLPEEAYELIMSWLYPAIMCALELDNPPKNVSELSIRLGCSPAEVQSAIDKLKKFEIVNEDENGTIETRKVFFKTAEDVPNDLVRRYHLEGLELAKEAIKLPVESREFQSVTFEGGVELFPQVKTRIRQMRDEVVADMQTGSKTQVYRMNIQVWPLSVEDKNETSGLLHD